MIESENNYLAGPLQGVKVVDITRPVAGATCTWILSNMGAETISIEQPGKSAHGTVSYLGTGKKSITLNLKTDKGKDILRRLILWGDVLVENYRPGVMKRLGFDYPSVHSINPHIIMTSISGYGQTGPHSQRGGFDSIGQAMGGLMSLIGAPGGPPGDSGTNLADVSSGVFGALGTTLALYHQKSTGAGQHVEATLVESIVFFLVERLISTAQGMGIERSPSAFRRRLPGAGWFKSKDGPWIVIMAQNNEHWQPMSAILGRPELAEAPGFATRQQRGDHAEEIYGLMEKWVGSHNADEVEALVEKADIPFGRVQTLQEVLKDPQLKSRGMFKNIELDGDILPLFGPYPILSATPGSLRKPAKLGEHNEEIYNGLLGYSAEEMAALKSEGVI